MKFRVKPALTAAQLIENKLKEMPDAGVNFSYTCLDTGGTFSADQPCEFSPFTGSQNIDPIEAVGEDSQENNTPIPGNQSDPFKQTPLMDNPTGETGFDWSTVQLMPNPAPDQGIGADHANGDGYVDYPQSSVPGYSKMSPNART